RTGRGGRARLIWTLSGESGRARTMQKVPVRRYYGWHSQYRGRRWILRMRTGRLTYRSSRGSEAGQSRKQSPSDPPHSLLLYRRGTMPRPFLRGLSLVKTRPFVESTDCVLFGSHVTRRYERV